MKRWNRWTVWVSLLLAISLVAGCSNAATYVKDSYSLVDMDGKGKEAAKVYEAEGKTVPQVAQEIAAEEKPQEMSKEDPEQMFLVYDNRIVNLQKSPENADNTLIEIDTIEYAKTHYDSSFLQGYLTATLIQSLFGNSWWSSGSRTATSSAPSYKGYSYGSKNSTTTSSTDDKKPATTDRTGSFTSKGAFSSGGTSSGSKSSGSASSGSSGSSSGSTKSGIGSWFSSSSSSGSSSARKNDGSTPSIKPKSSSKPSTSIRSGGFSSKGGKRR